MRIALVPSFYFDVLNSTSGCRMVWQLADGMLRNAGRVGLVMPDLSSNRFKLDRDDFNRVVRSGQVHELTVLQENRKYEECLPTDGLRDLVDKILYEYPVDAVVVFGARRHLTFKRLLEVRQPLQPFAVDLPVIPWIDDPATPDKPHATSDYEIIGDLIGAAWGPALYSTSQDIASLINHARGWLSFNQLKKIQEQAKVVGFCIDTEKFYEIDDTREAGVHSDKQPWPNGPAVLTYCGQLTAKKNVDFMLECVSKAHAMGKNVSAVVSTWWKEKDIPQPIRDAINKGAHIDLRTEVPWGGQFRALRQGDIGLCLSTDEGAGSGHTEMLASGLMMIYRYKPWMDGMIPPGYPFVAKSMDEVEKMYFWVIDHLDEAKQMVKKAKVREHLDKNFSMQSVGKNFIDALTGIVQKNRRKSAAWITDAITNSITTGAWGDKLTLDEACKKLSSVSDKGLKFGRGGISTLFVREQFLACGWKDVGDSKNIVLSRGAN